MKIERLDYQYMTKRSNRVNSVNMYKKLLYIIFILISKKPKIKYEFIL